MGNEASSAGKVSKEDREEWKGKYGIPQEKFELVMKSFRKHANSEGKICREAFKTILSGVMHEELAEQVFDSFDRDHSNTMDVNEYLMMMGVTYGGTVEQKLRASFSLFDKNGDGVLSKAEITDMFLSIVRQKRAAERFRLTKIRTAASAEPIDAKAMAAIEGVINSVFEKVDVDKSGTIDLSEFIRGFSAHPSVCGFFIQF